MNGKNRNALKKLAGTIGVAGFGSLFALPAMAQSPLNPNPTIFSEAPYTRTLAQATPDSSMPMNTPTSTPSSSTLR